MSFWIAALSLIAFVTGNMMGQHGWYAFWASVLGKETEYIAFTGTVPPLATIPDYEKWAKLGGDSSKHSFAQVPQDLLIPFPTYYTEKGRGSSVAFSTDHGGTYSNSTRAGSHNGVDIRTPIGNTVQSIANGRVIKVQSVDNGGFGKFVSIEHPNVPDPMRPGETTSLVSSYSHLSSIFVSVGEIVLKGQGIALTGNTGTSTGPHLQFQVDRKEAKWFPYWTFTEDEARRAGLNNVQAVNSGLFRSRLNIYTVHPLLFVQSNDNPSSYIVRGDSTDRDVEEVREPVATSLSYRDLVAKRRADRLEAARIRQRSRVARKRFSERSVTQVLTVQPRRNSPIVHRQTLVSIQDDTEPVYTAAPVSAGATNVATVTIEHDGSYTGRGWERLEITLLDAQGRPVVDPKLGRPIELRTAFGRAEFKPASLSFRDFRNGVATVQMLPRGRRTVVVEVVPLRAISRPMRYER